MPIPDTNALRSPVLEAIFEERGAVKSPKIRFMVAQRLELTPEDIGQPAPVSPVGVYTNHVAWALVWLQEQKLITGRGKAEDRKYQITQAGRNALRNGADLENAPDEHADTEPAPPFPPTPPPDSGLELDPNTASAEENSGPDVAGLAPDPAAEATPDEPEDAVEPAAPSSRRPFDPDAPPPAGPSGMGTFDVGEALAASEKATQSHHLLLVRLYRWLARSGWSDLEEDRSVDLWGTSPGGARAIFEAKTIEENELTQLRSALAQVFEYRALFGAEDDLLAVVVNQPVSGRRAEVLEKLGVGLLLSAADSDSLVARNTTGMVLLGNQ